MFENQVLVALMLTCLGAAGTALGGLMVVAQPKMEFKRLGYLQGLAAGLMLCISVFDLYAEAAEEVGSGQAALWFYGGVVFFALIVNFCPEPPASLITVDIDDAAAAQGKKGKKGGAADAPAALALDAPTPAMGTRSRSKSTAAIDSDEGPRPRRTTRSAASTSAAPPTPTPSSPKSAAKTPSRQASVTALTDAVKARSTSGAVCAAEQRAAKQRVLMSGLVTALGIALHNFPEGVAVFLASMKSRSMGASLAIAIALHNIPEGVAVSLPVYFATGSRLKGFMYAFTSGLAEPLAVVVLALFFPKDINQQLVNKLLASVGGIMAFLAIHELLPLSFEHAGHSRGTLCLFAGMALMSLNMHILHEWMGMDH